jgi:hypothetical protein
MIKKQTIGMSILDFYYQKDFLLVIIIMQPELILVYEINNLNSTYKEIKLEM